MLYAVYHFWSWPILLVVLVSVALVERFFSASVTKRRAVSGSDCRL